MAQKARSLIKNISNLSDGFVSSDKFIPLSILLILGVFVLEIGCNNLQKNSTQNKETVLEKVDISQIPHDTISIKEGALKLVNGIYYLDNKSFSGFIVEKYETGAVNSIGSYYLGKQHGTTKTFYSDGKSKDERNYKDNIGYGRHFGYWENGKMKFDFMYINDRREGLQQQWYVSGTPYCVLNFKNDREDGMQKAWRENGKPYINYEVKDGIRYGLQKAALCYTLKKGEIKLKN